MVQFSVKSNETSVSCSVKTDDFSRVLLPLKWSKPRTFCGSCLPPPEKCLSPFPPPPKKKNKNSDWLPKYSREKKNREKKIKKWKEKSGKSSKIV